MSRIYQLYSYISVYITTRLWLASFYSLNRNFLILRISVRESNLLSEIYILQLKSLHINVKRILFQAKRNFLRKEWEKIFFEKQN